MIIDLARWECSCRRLDYCYSGLDGAFNCLSPGSSSDFADVFDS
jgi:hypothetical protein